MTATTTHIAVLITCFNRQQKTLRCLQSLAAQLQFSLVAPAASSSMPASSAATSIAAPSLPANDAAVPSQAQLTVYLLDNGNDGTFEAVAAQFPWVRLSRGHADLYWNSAMRRLWQQAVPESLAAGSSLTSSPYDFYLWLNDDVRLDADAIPRLLQCFLFQTPAAGALIGTMAGTMATPGNANQTRVASYGGRSRISSLNPLAFGPVLTPTQQPQPCTFINGNLCLIPKAAVAAVGLLSAHFSHGLGDFDYGLRLQAAGFTLYVAPGFYGECAVNPKAGSVFDQNVPFSQRLAMLKRPNVLPPCAEWRYFARCHGGWVWPLLWLKSWGRQLLPSCWLWLKQRRVV